MLSRVICWNNIDGGILEWNCQAKCTFIESSFWIVCLFNISFWVSRLKVLFDSVLLVEHKITQHLKPLDPFGTEKKIKVHRFTNNLQGLQKVVVKDFSYIYYSMKCFTFWENSKTISILDSENYGFILNTCHDTAKRADTRVGFLVIFSRLRWPIEPRFSQVCYLI